MPIHAAGLYDTKTPVSLHDYAVSSYIPSLGALIAARSRESSPIEKDSLLVVIQPQTPGLQTLPNTVVERDRIISIVPKEIILHLGKPGIQINDGSDATVENVTKMLPSATIVHFACHGQHNVNDPIESRVVLYDGGLSLLQLMRLETSKPSIAFLSACHSAAGHKDNPDETVHLASGMLAVGFKSVVATMW